jgi:hypothetical protein
VNAVSIVRVGSNKKYADGWEAAFSGKKRSKKTSSARASSKGTKRSGAKKPAKKGGRK